jgi:hypothetical protein
MNKTVLIIASCVVIGVLLFLALTWAGAFGTVVEDDFCSYNDCTKLNNTKVM